MKNFSKNLFTSITIILVYFSLIFTPNLMHAEGTVSLAPSASDEAALFIGAGNTGGGGGDYGLFAWKGSSSKLYFNVENTCEKAYFGFSIPKNDRSFATINPVTGQSNHEQNLIFRIIDPLGNPINNLSCFGNTIIAGEAWQILDASTVNISTRNDAINGPTQLGNPSGYNAFVLDLSACGLNLTGNYSIEFFSTDPSYNPNTASSGFYIPYFDVTVADCSSTGQTGRVWSNNWGLGIKRDGDGPFDRAFNGSFYVCSEEGFITQIDFNTNTNNRAEANKNNDQNSGFRAGAFNVSFNTNGPGTSGNIAADRKSMPNVNSPNPQLPVFLNLPDPDFCPLEEVGTYQPAVNFLTGCPGDWCINIQTTQPGQFEILIEGANGNGQLDMPADRILIYQITANDSVVNPQTPGYIYEVCIPWDGKDGLGNFVNQGDVTISGFYGQGIYHFPVYDAEFNDDGFVVSTVQPALGPQLLFYDDQMITELSNTTEPKNGTNGCNGPCHSWTGEWENFTNVSDVYGNFNTINTWWFAVREGADLTTNFSTSSPISITCPADFSGCSNSDISPIVTGIPTVNAPSANCAYTSGYIDVIAATNTCNEPTSIDRKWFAFFNNLPADSVFCIQHIELEAPEIFNCPDDILIACSTNGGNIATWTSPVIGSGSGVGNCNPNDWVLQQTTGPTSGSVFPVGTTTVTYEISGSCAATCEFDVVVEPGVSLECPADYVGCIGDNIKPSNTGEATVTGNSAVCPYNLDYTDEVLATNNCNDPTSIKRTWFVVKTVPPSVSGVANDSIICCQLITLEAPIIENCPSDIMATCSAQGGGSIVNWTVPTIGSASGNCSFNNLQLQQVAGPAPGSIFPIGATLVSYELTGVGSCKEVCSFTVIVNAGITITCPADYVGCTGGNITPSTTGQASVQGDVANCPYTLNYIDRTITQNTCNEPTFVERKWYAYFNSNPTDTVSCIQKIQLETPSFTYCPADIYVTCSPASGTVVTWTTPSGSCNGTTASIQQTAGPVSGSVFPVGTTTITYEIPGSCGATCSFDVIVEAGVSLECPADYVGCIGDNVKPSNTGQATVTGNGGACPYNLDYTDEILTTNDCNEPTSIKRKWFVIKAIPPSVTGAPADSLICCQLITLEAPIIEDCPSDIISNCSAQGGGSVVTWTPPTVGSVSGNCSFNNLQLQQVAGPAPGSVFPIGVTTVSYELKGIGSCKEVCSFTVTVNAGISIICPADYVGCTSGNIAPLTTGQANVQGDVASCPYTLNYIDRIITQNTCNEPTFVERKWYAYFNSNPTDTVSCIQKIQLATPAFTYCPADIYITCSPAAGSVVTWTPPSGSCNGTTASIQQTAGPVSGSVFPVGTTTITYEIPGSCGATCSFDVIVGPGISLECPADYVGCIGDNLKPSNTGQATVTGNGAACPYNLDYTDEILETNDCNEPTSIKRKWFVVKAISPSVTGAPADSLICCQLITLEAPIIEDCPVDIISTCSAQGGGSVVTWTPPSVGSVSGNCSFNNLQLQQVAGPAPGSVFPIGVTTVSYELKGIGSCKEVCSFTVTVNAGISISCPADYVGCIGGNNSLAITGQASVQGDVASCPYTLNFIDKVITNNACNEPTFVERKWYAYFDSNPTDTVSCIQKIQLATPTFTYCPADIYITCSPALGSVVTWTPPSGTSCNGTTASIQQTTGPVSGSVFPVGTTTITYEIPGSCGATCSFDVIVEPGISITCPADFVGCTGGNIAPSTTGQASVQGAVGSCPYTLNYIDRIITSNTCNEPTFIERKWYAYLNSNPTDTVSCLQKIQLATPTFTYCPADIYVTCSPTSGSVVTWTLPSGSCNGNPASIQQTGGLVSGSVFPVGTTTITYSISGSCGATCSFDIIVEPGISLTCAADYYGCAGGNLTPSITDQPIIEGKAGSCPYTLKYTDKVLTTNACGDATVIQRKWVACINNNPPTVAETEPTDSTFCFQKLFLEAPILTNCPNDIVVPCDASGHGGVVTWTPPTISFASGYCTSNNYQLQQVAGPAPGSIFPTGTTTVTYQIVGSCDEVCSFNVTVDQGITAHCGSDIEVDCENGQNGAVVSFDLPTIETCCNNCPSDGDDLPGFVYMGNYNGHNYYCSEGKADWNTARLHCENMGGYLAVLDDAYESNMLSSFLQTQHAFIGLHDSNVEGQFEWVNGAPVNFTNWSYGQPNNYRNYQDFGQLMPNGQWNDNYNSTCAEYILELPCTSSKQISGLPSGSVFPVGTTTVSYAVSDACGAKDTCSFDVTVNECAYFEPEYCDAEGRNTNFFWIRHIVCGDINNQSGDNGGYGDFTYLNTLFIPGTEQTIVCAPGYSRYYYNVQWKVCIDFNGDGDFNDLHEEVLSYGTYKILKAKFDIPYHCVTGETRMRVTMKYGSPADCCGSFKYGEVEDYTITIAPQPDLQEVSAESRTIREPRIELTGNENVTPRAELPTEAALEVKLYPNPVQFELNLLLDESTAFIGNISIYNNLGQRVYNDFKESFSNQLTIDIAHLPDGLYYLNMESDTGQTIVKKFLKE